MVSNQLGNNQIKYYDIEANNSDDEGSDADDSSNEGVIEEYIEDLFEEDDETESSDGEIGDLFE